MVLPPTAPDTKASFDRERPTRERSRSKENQVHFDPQPSHPSTTDKQTQQELHDLKVQLFAKEQKITDYEKRCESLTSKVDSLVKFLEEERVLRKKAETKTEEKEREMIELDKALNNVKTERHQTSENEKGLAENLRNLKEENDRLRRDKCEGLDANQQAQYKIIDLESRLRAA